MICRHVTRIPRALAIFLSKSGNPERLVSLGDNWGISLIEGIVRALNQSDPPIFVSDFGSRRDGCEEWGHGTTREPEGAQTSDLGQHWATRQLGVSPMQRFVDSGQWGLWGLLRDS